MKLNRPHWLKRLQEWRTEAREAIQTLIVTGVVFALLAGLLSGLSTFIGEHHPWLSLLASIPAMCFAVIAAISILGYAVFLYAFIFSSAVYYPLKIGYRITELLLTLLEKLFRLARSFLPHVEVPRIITGISLLLTLGIFKFLREKGLDTSDLVYLLIASGVAAEVINAVIRHIMAKFRKT